jgi:hypothetical protein
MTSGRRGARSSRPPSHGPASTGAYTQSPARAARLVEPVRSRIQMPATTDMALPPKPDSREIATNRPALRRMSPPS